MKPLYVNYKGVAPEGDATMRTADEVDTVLDGIRDWLAGHGALLMLIGFAGDAENGPLLQAGIHGTKGLLTYDGPQDEQGLLSHNGARRPGDPVYYFFQGTKAEFPSSAEVPYEQVKRAVKEFGSGGGALPGSVTWRPDTDD